MAYKLVGQNCLAQITTRGAQDGTPAALGTPAAFPMSLVKSISLDLTAATADVSGLGDAVEIVQVTRISREVKVEVYIPDTGAQFDECIGFYCQIDLKDSPNDTVYKSYDGVITSYSKSNTDGAATESFTLKGAANGL